MHARDARGDQGIGARRRAAGVTARFEADVSGRAARCCSRLAQRQHFGMGVAGAGVESLADDDAVAHEHAADAPSATRVSFRGMHGRLFVPHQDVANGVLLEQRIVDRQHRAAGVAEQVLDTMIDQRPHDHGCAGHLVRIVARLAHRLLRMRVRRAASSWVSANKKGPKRPLHTA